MAGVSNSLLRDAIWALEMYGPKRVNVDWVRRRVRVGPSMAARIVDELQARRIVAPPDDRRGNRHVLMDLAGLRSVLADLDGSHVPPHHRPDIPVGEVELLDLTPEDRLCDPGQLDVGRSVAVGEFDADAVHQQVHRDRVAQTFGEHQ